jgi:hypothetical protein
MASAVATLADAQAGVSPSFLASVHGGVGVGAAFAGYPRLVARPDRTEGVFSAMYLVNYLAFGLPSLAAGRLALLFGITPTISGYCLLVLASAGLQAAIQPVACSPGIAGRESRARQDGPIVPAVAMLANSAISGDRRADDQARQISAGERS